MPSVQNTIGIVVFRHPHQWSTRHKGRLNLSTPGYGLETDFADRWFRTGTSLAAFRLLPPQGAHAILTITVADWV